MWNSLQLEQMELYKPCCMSCWGCITLSVLTKQLDVSLSEMSPAKLVSLLCVVGTGRKAEHKVIGAEGGSVDLINHFCRASDALLSNADPPMWWHTLLKNTTRHPLHPNPLLSEWMRTVVKIKGILCVGVSGGSSVFVCVFLGLGASGNTAFTW